MKQHLLFLLFCLLPCVVHGQAAIGLDEINIVNVGIDNPITIVAENTPLEKLIVATDNGTITGSEGHYILRPDHPGDSLTITVSVTTSGGSKVLSKSYYKAICISGTYVRLLGKTGGTISAKEMKYAIAPVAPIIGWGFDAKIKITSLTVIVWRNGAELFRKTVNNERGLKFSDNEEVEHMMQTLRPGDKFNLEDMHYCGPGQRSCDGYLMPLEFTITD